jgi:hypothetical protein
MWGLGVAFLVRNAHVRAHALTHTHTDSHAHLQKHTLTHAHTCTRTLTQTHHAQRLALKYSREELGGDIEDSTLPDDETLAQHGPTFEAFSDAVYGADGAGAAGKTAGAKRKAGVSAWLLRGPCVTVSVSARECARVSMWA